MNVVLIGFRCSGKTSVGKLLARNLTRKFVDLDEAVIELAGCSIEEIVLSRGWEHFRDLERKAVEKFTTQDNLVIAGGGGVVNDRGNVDNLRRNGWVVWLHVNAQVVRDRMANEQRAGKVRPSLTGKDPLREVTDLLNLRIPLYESAHDMRLNTNELSIQQAADLIMRKLPPGGGAREQ
ncbi:MAG: shikimate kinase [Desulfobacteraceae bacterium]|jgi:shikimate kinase